jgi:transposase
VQEIEELKRQSLSIGSISRLTGYDRKTASKHLANPEGLPAYGPREKQASKLEAFRAYLHERMQAGVWNGRVLLRELRERVMQADTRFSRLAATETASGPNHGGTAI